MSFVVPEWIKSDWDLILKQLKDFPASDANRYRMRQTREYSLGFLQGQLSGMRFAIICMPKEES